MSTCSGTARRLGRSDAGFTLVSLIVALVLLSVGVLAVSTTLTQSVSMQTIISLRKTALDVAGAYMEDVKSRDPLSLASEAEVRVDAVGDENAYGLFTRTLTVESIGTHLMRVTVTVTAPRSAPVELVTLVWDGVV